MTGGRLDLDLDLGPDLDPVLADLAGYLGLDLDGYLLELERGLGGGRLPVGELDFAYLGPKAFANRMYIGIRLRFRLYWIGFE